MCDIHRNEVDDMIKKELVHGQNHLFEKKRKAKCSSDSHTLVCDNTTM